MAVYIGLVRRYEDDSSNIYGKRIVVEGVKNIENGGYIERCIIPLSKKIRLASLKTGDVIEFEATKGSWRTMHDLKYIKVLSSNSSLFPNEVNRDMYYNVRVATDEELYQKDIEEAAKLTLLGYGQDMDDYSLAEDYFSD